MDITKYGHACFVVEKSGVALVIDPGSWTTDLKIPSKVTGIIVTHEHPDHCDPSLIQDIIDANPEAVVYAHRDVQSMLGEQPFLAVESGDAVTVADFTLRFTGGAHAAIADHIPVPANLGVMIDDMVYYPGDSFSLPEGAVEIVAVPAAAPWMKFSEAADFLRAVKPRLVFPTHDAILSESGKELADAMLSQVCHEIGAEYHRL